jgi:hypothetical protein
VIDPKEVLQMAYTSRFLTHLQERLGSSLVGVVEAVSLSDVFDAHDRDDVLLASVGYA